MPGAMAQTWLPIPRNEDYVGNWPAAAPRPGVSLCYTSCKFIRADVAQLVEQPIRKRQVVGSRFCGAGKRERAWTALGAPPCTTSVAVQAQVPRVGISTCNHKMTFPIMTRVTTDTRVPIQSSGPASHSADHGAPVGGMGKSRTGGRRRELYVLRSAANQESPRPVRQESAPGGHPPVPAGHAKAGRRHGEPAAGGGGFLHRPAHRLPA